MFCVKFLSKQIAEKSATGLDYFCNQGLLQYIRYDTIRYEKHACDSEEGASGVRWGGHADVIASDLILRKILQDAKDARS